MDSYRILLQKRDSRLLGKGRSKSPELIVDILVIKFMIPRNPQYPSAWQVIRDSLDTLNRFITDIDITR